MKRPNLPKDTSRTVYSHNHKSIEGMIKRFKKKIQQSGILDEYKERTFYVKPSIVKREKLKRAVFNAKRKNKDS